MPSRSCQLHKSETTQIINEKILSYPPLKKEFLGHIFNFESIVVEIWVWVGK
jgi:hypothetical protein